MQTALLSLLISISSLSIAQNTIYTNKVVEHKIYSNYLNEDRIYWVSLPLRYADTLTYPVIYVFDAEWRFDLVKSLVFDLGANNKIQKSIVVGIPHIDWKEKRGRDLTFSQTRIEYDGEQVDSVWYNDSNSGDGMKFYNYLTEELISSVNQNYRTNNHQTLIGHSYGGYFGAYILSLDHPFEVIHMYDPSIWFSNGEVIDLFRETNNDTPVKVHLTYQPKPEFHKTKIEELINELEGNQNILLTTDFYDSDTHNSLFLDSFYKGILQTNR